MYQFAVNQRNDCSCLGLKVTSEVKKVNKMSNKHVIVIASLVLMCYVHHSKGVIEGSQPNTIKDEDKNNTNKERAGRSLHKECSEHLSSKCLKIQVLSFLEDLSSRDELPLLSGLSIVKENRTNATTPEEMAAELSRKFPGKPEEKLNKFLLYRLQDYLDSHSLKYRLLDSHTTEQAINIARGKGEETVGRKKDGGFGGGGFGGGGGHKGGGNGALLAAALFTKGTLAAAALGALALLAGKALMTALISLLLSALVGLKGHGGHKSTTYEIITKPEVSHHHSQSHEEQHVLDGHHGDYRRVYEPDYNSYMSYDAKGGSYNAS